MSRKLGIVTPYGQHELTYAAIQTAELAEASGMDASLYTRSNIRSAVDGAWDSRVVTQRKQQLREWVDNVTTVLWMKPPPITDLCDAQNSGVRNLQFAAWDYLGGEHDQMVCCAMDDIISPANIIAKTLQHLWMGKVRCHAIPWQTPFPTIRGDRVRSDKVVNVFFPFWDSQVYRVNARVVQLIKRLLDRYDNVHCTIAIHKRCLWRVKHYLHELHDEFNERCVVWQSPPKSARIGIMAQQDLMVWPAEYDGICWPASMAVTMGVPVVAWDIYPHNELLLNGCNATLVPCDVQTNSFGMPIARGNYDEFYRSLCNTLEHQLRPLQSTVNTGIVERQQRFQQLWCSLLS